MTAGYAYLLWNASEHGRKGPAAVSLGVVTRFSVTGHPMPSNVDRRVACDSLRVEGERSWFGKHEKIVVIVREKMRCFPSRQELHWKDDS